MTLIRIINSFGLLIALCSGCTSPEQFINSLKSQNETYISMRKGSSFGGYQPTYEVLILQSGEIYYKGKLHPYKQEMEVFTSHHSDSGSVSRLFEFALSIDFFGIRDSCEDVIDAADNVQTTVTLNGRSHTIAYSHMCWRYLPEYGDLVQFERAIDSLANVL